MTARRPRSHAAARTAGARFERQVADFLAAHVDDRIDRRVRTGARDRGDLTGLRHLGLRIVVEVKNTTRWAPGPWLDEAETERGNDDADVGLVVAKRHGRGDPGDAVVLMSLADLARLLGGAPAPQVLRNPHPAAKTPPPTPPAQTRGNQ